MANPYAAVTLGGVKPIPPLPPGRWKIVAAAVGVFLLAFGVRLVFLFGSADRTWPHSVYYEGDAPLWADWAQHLEQGAPFNHDLPIWAPGTARLVNWLMPPKSAAAAPNAPRDFTRVKVAWSAMSAATCAMLYWILSGTAGGRIALLAAFIAVFSFQSYVLATSLNSETPYALLLAILVALGFRLRTRPGWLAFAIFGLFNGLAALMRPEHPLGFVLLMVWLLWPSPTTPASAALVTGPVGRKRNWHLAVSAAAGFVLAVLPWTWAAHRALLQFNTAATPPPIYTQQRLPWSADARARVEAWPAFARTDNVQFITDMLASKGRSAVTAAEVDAFLAERFGAKPEPLSNWALISNQGALCFVLANDIQCDGGFCKRLLGGDFGADPELHLSHPGHLRLFNHGFALGLATIQDQPGPWLALLVRKFERFGAGICSGFGATNAPPGRAGLRPAVDVLITPQPVWQGISALLAALGAFVTWRRAAATPWLIVLCYKLIVTALFYGYARQAASIGPVFAFFIAVTIDRLLDLVQRRAPWPRWIEPGALAALAILLVTTDIIAARSHAELTVRGPARLAPQWGNNAWVAPGPVELKVGAPAAGN